MPVVLDCYSAMDSLAVWVSIPRTEIGVPAGEQGITSTTAIAPSVDEDRGGVQSAVHDAVAVGVLDCLGELSDKVDLAA